MVTGEKDMSLPIRKVLFIEPKAPRPHIFSRVVIPRLGSVLLGTILQNQGLEVKVVVEEVSQPDYRLLDFKPDLVGISSISSTAPRAYALAEFYRQLGVPVVLGGAHPSFLPEEGLQHADYVICGEGETALPLLIQTLNHGGNFEDIPNLCYKEGEQIRRNPWGPFIEDLDRLPIPNYDLIHNWRAKSRRFVSIATSRGCPFNCSFCSVILLFGRKYRYNSVDRVMEEIRQNGANAKHIFFCDDNFTANRERIKELCGRLLQEGLKLEWSAQVRVEAARDPELLDLMAKSGCYTVFVGLESINPATLKAYNKGQSVEHIKECVINFHKYGIRVHGMFVFGSEEDHYQVIRDTVTFSRQLDLDSLQYLILTPVPGTKVFAELEKQNRIICRDWSHYDGHHTVFQPRQFMPHELQQETLRAMKKFYSWPSVFKRLLARDWFYVKLRTYGRLLLWYSFREESVYINYLKRQVFSRVQQLKSWFKGLGQVTRVGIPAESWALGGWDARTREFLLRFMERLGVEVIQETVVEPPEPGPWAALQAEIARLQGKADLILLPLREGMGGLCQKVKDLTQEAGVRLLPLEFSRDSFYRACMELGLCFRRRLKRLRRIYFQTLKEVGAEI
uniref:B12-binding domain-containing radical SAM protein n=1 Tax=Desulfobacca acetoxidans TaxID=60893 RepID=A0A7C5EN34_9BACT